MQDEEKRGYATRVSVPLVEVREGPADEAALAAARARQARI